MAAKELEELESELQEEDLRALLEQEAASHQVKILGFLPASYRLLTSNRKISSVEDLKGLKIRIYDNQISETLWEALGAVPLVYSYSEVYSAMQSGLIEANPEATLQDIISMGFYEQQKYVVNTCQQVYLEPVFISRVYYDSLEPERQEEILRAVEQALQEAVPLLESIQQKAKLTLAQAGVEWIDLEKTEQDKMTELLKGPLETLFRDTEGDEVVDQLLAVLQ